LRARHPTAHLKWRPVMGVRIVIAGQFGDKTAKFVLMEADYM
jgi:hypothetical protein